jgi:hypothetical protein
MTRICHRCRRPFEPGPNTQRARECLVCWKELRGYPLTASDRALRAMQDAYARDVRPRAVMGPVLDEGRIMALVKLCHPDRHRNSEQANEATSWLLSMRRP